MKYIKKFETIEDKITVRIKPNIHNKSKWYYGAINKNRDLTGKIIIVKNSKNPSFDNDYCYDDSLYISKDDCEYIATNIDKYNL